MGEVAATYLVRITLRRRDEPLPPSKILGIKEPDADPPTLEVVQAAIAGAMYGAATHLEASVSAERVDK